MSIELVSNVHGLLAKAIGAAVDGDTGFVGDLELPDDAWVQITWDAINTSYPLSVNPKIALHDLELPPYVTLEEWGAGSFVTFGHGADDIDRLASFVGELVAAIRETAIREAKVRAED